MVSPIKFGTDGWRAIIAEDFTFANVRLCAQAVADYLHGHGQAEQGLVVGFDTRFASDRFAAAVAEVAAANGVRVYLCNGPHPTPVIAYSIKARQAGGGVVITSSHNPAAYNGFKYKPEYAGSASPEVVEELERRINHIEERGTVRTISMEDGVEKGLINIIDPLPDYMAKLETLVDLPFLRLQGLRVVADAMYGAGDGYFEQILSGGLTTVATIRNSMNPLFPGINPEPIEPNLGALLDAVRAEGAEVGLATDGDSDRIGVVDEKGNFIDQLKVYALLLYYLLDVRGQRGPAVRSITSTAMADRLGALYNVPVDVCPVGFKYIGPRMMELDAIMGGEESGGYGFRGHIPERDAILAGLYILDLVARKGKPLSALIREIEEKVGPFHYHRVDLHFSPEQRQSILARVASAKVDQIDGSTVVAVDTRDGYRFAAEDGSWLLIRFSGTEPLLRIYTETTSPERVQRILTFGRELAGV